MFLIMEHFAEAVLELIVNRSLLNYRDGCNLRKIQSWGCSKSVYRASESLEIYA